MKRCFLMISALAIALVAIPATASPPPDWNSLSEADRAVLVAPVQERWNRASPEQRERMLQRARLWATMTPEQKALAREGMQRFRSERQDRRQALRDVWQHVQSLPPEQRDALRAQWRALTPEQRREWVQAGGPGRAPPPANE